MKPAEIVGEAPAATATPEPGSPPAPAPAPAEPAVPDCRACAAGLGLDQRYCLNCGEPVVGLAPPLDAPIREPAAAVAAAGLGALPVAARSPTAVRPLAALGCATLAGALLTALLIAALGGNNPQPIAVNVPAAKAPVVNVQAGGATAAAVEAAFVSDWPGGSGWVVQLQVLPKDGTTAAAVAAAKTTAVGSGAKDVGALDSDEHGSLDPGNYVVYSGLYKTKAKAVAAAKGLKKSFAGATVVRVADAAAPKATKESTKKLKDLRESSGDDYTEKSKKLPDEVVTPGPEAPADEPGDVPADRGEEETIG